MVGIQELCTNGHFDALSLLDQDAHDFGAVDNADVSSVLPWLRVFQELIGSKVGASCTASNRMAIDEGLRSEAKEEGC